MRTYEAFGESKTWNNWKADARFVVNERTVRTRLASGWDFERAISETPRSVPLHEAFGEKKRLKDWVADDRCLVGEATLLSRLQLGWGFQEALTTTSEIKTYSAFGESKSIYAWAKDERSKVNSYRVLLRRLADGDTLEAAMSRPSHRAYIAFGEKRTSSEWLMDGRCKASPARLAERMWESGVRDGDNIEIQLTTPIGDSRSLREDGLAQYLSTHIDLVRSDRIQIAPKELDIWIPSKSLAIEFNGLYWHSEKFKHKNYHREKYLACKDRGIRLLQVWEDDWLYRRPIVEGMILNRLGLNAADTVGARKTMVDRVVPVAEARRFLERNHIQGWTSASYRYGLRFEGELVALLNMKSVLGQDADWDLVRYATDRSVPGGFSKLLKAFRSDHAGSIKTFADLTWSDGDLYKKTGFKQTAILEPDYCYVRANSRQREHKFGYRKSRFEADPDLMFDPTLTEAELAKLNGLTRIYDAGKIKFILK